MSRLLQALKSLDARSPKPSVGKGLLAHLADKFHAPSADPPASSQDDADQIGKATSIKPVVVDHPLAYLSSGVPTILLQTPPREALAAPALDFAPVFVNELLAPPSYAPPSYAPPSYAPPAVSPPLPPPPEPAFTPTPPPGPPAPAPVAEDHFPHAAPQPAVEPSQPERHVPATPTRQATLLERTVRRTLADPQRSEPYRQLADRLRTDLDQVAGRSLLLAGVGPASETHEAVLHAAAVLADAGESILVIDGDAAHRTLTCQLDLPDSRGLAEFARGEGDARDLVQPTALGGLSFLPLGKARLPEPGSVANRLASLVQSLEESYRLVLIDGGRTGELASATLARLCDATYFVVRLGETEAAQAQTALRDFRAAGARVMGCIATS